MRAPSWQRKRSRIYCNCSWLLRCVATPRNYLQRVHDRITRNAVIIPLLGFEAAVHLATFLFFLSYRRVALSFNVIGRWRSHCALGLISAVLCLIGILGVSRRALTLVQVVASTSLVRVTSSSYSLAALLLTKCTCDQAGYRWPLTGALGYDYQQCGVVTQFDSSQTMYNVVADLSGGDHRVHLSPPSEPPIPQSVLKALNRGANSEPATYDDLRQRECHCKLKINMPVCNVHYIDSEDRVLHWCQLSSSEACGGYNWSNLHCTSELRAKSTFEACRGSCCCSGIGINPSLNHHEQKDFEEDEPIGAQCGIWDKQHGARPWCYVGYESSCLPSQLFFYRREPEAKSHHLEELAQGKSSEPCIKTLIQAAARRCAQRVFAMTSALFLLSLTNLILHFATGRYMLNGCQDVVPTEVQFQVHFFDHAWGARRDSESSASSIVSLQHPEHERFSSACDEAYGEPTPKHAMNTGVELASMRSKA